MRIRPCLIGLAAIVGLSSVGRAQQAAVSDSAILVADSTVAATAGEIRSSMDRPSDAVRRSTPALELAAPQSTANLGRPKAMMVVGGAGIVVGALVGGDAGRIIMVGGAVVGLYGLWQYLQ
jgi:hypothetical protein